MDLQTYIKSFPRNQRTTIRTQLADAHGVSEVTVRAWANLTRRHPYTLNAIKITERETGNLVTRHDLRPEIFGVIDSEPEPVQCDATPTETHELKRKHEHEHELSVSEG